MKRLNFDDLYVVEMMMKRYEFILNYKFHNDKEWHRLDFLQDKYINFVSAFYNKTQF